jgi:hypothetical protein
MKMNGRYKAIYMAYVLGQESSCDKVEVEYLGGFSEWRSINRVGEGYSRHLIYTELLGAAANGHEAHRSKACRADGPDAEKPSSDAPMTEKRPRHLAK